MSVNEDRVSYIVENNVLDNEKLTFDLSPFFQIGRAHV